MRVVLATRRSPLALAQTTQVADALVASGAEVELLPLVTSGDRWSAEGGPAPDKGLFVKELEEALLSGEADLAVHSAKDLPAELPPGLAVLATPPRADPRDVLVGARGGLAGLSAGARVATGSPRRSAQLRVARPDLEIVPIRGNVDTRLRKLAEGEADALVLAAAGLARLGVQPAAVEALPEDRFPPAPGQGTLALEGRPERTDLLEVLADLADADTAFCTEVERAVLRALGGGCQEPIGAWCGLVDGRLRIAAFRADDELGRNARSVEIEGSASEAFDLAEEVATRLGGA